MNKYKSDDYKLGAVKYYLKHNDSMDKVYEELLGEKKNQGLLSVLCTLYSVLCNRPTTRHLHPAYSQYGVYLGATTIKPNNILIYPHQ